MSLPSVAVVVPMLNEEAGVADCVRSISAVLERLEASTALIVVDDGSTDATRDILHDLSPDNRLVILSHDSRQGYGRALRTGAREAERLGFQYVLFMDSDLTNPPEDIERFVPEMQRGIDLIKGSRFRAGGGMVDVPFKRRLMTNTARFISRSMFRVGVDDCTNGFRAVKTAVFNRMPLTESGFSVILEEMYHAKRAGCTFANVPTVLYNRSDDQRPSLFAYNYRTLTQYLMYALKASFVRGTKSSL